MTLEPKCPVSPLDIMDALEKENIESRPIWKPMHLQPFYAGHDFISMEGDVGRGIFEQGLCLPSDIKMTAEEVEHIIKIVRGCF